MSKDLALTTDNGVLVSSSYKKEYMKRRKWRFEQAPGNEDPIRPQFLSTFSGHTFVQKNVGLGSKD